jgi:hypothetical protein
MKYKREKTVQQEQQQEQATGRQPLTGGTLKLQLYHYHSRSNATNTIYYLL